jgi:HAE1 family hydrophobic/amphiphilic exporter-1
MLPLLGSEFVPQADFSETTVQLRTPQGASLEATEARARQVEAVIRSLPEVRYTVTTINSGNAPSKSDASIYVRLTERGQRTRDVAQMSIALREALRQVPGITVTQVGLLDPVGGQKQIEFSIMGPDLGELNRLNRQLIPQLRQIPGLVDLDSSLKGDRPTVDVRVQRDAASELGLSVASIAGALRVLVAGETVGNWRADDDETYDVNVRMAPDARTQPGDLQRLPLTVTGSDGTARIVRLNQVAELRESSGPSQINRRALAREMQFSANASLRSVGEVSADIRQLLEAAHLPPGYRWAFAGSTKNMNESFAYAVSALALAIIFIYMILGSQFQSFLQPLALMTSLPLTLIGVVLALLMFHSAMSMFSIIGVVMLMGLVTKNAILLVDFAIRARQPHTGEDGQPHPGMPREQALLAAARVRLRPILMTTLAMVFGMVPLAFAVSEGSEQRAPMGQAVIGGVITSSLLTLVVVPVMYCYMDDLARWLGRRFGKPESAHPAQEP